MSPAAAGEWRYQGSRDPKEGGYWYRLDGWEHGYADAVRVTDLGSACGFRGAVLVEAVTVLLPVSEAELAACLAAIGLAPETLPEAEAARRATIVDACLAYGRFDPANTHPEPASEVLQLEEDPELGPMCHDGWTADRRLTEDLTAYVERAWLPRL